MKLFKILLLFFSLSYVHLSHAETQSIMIENINQEMYEISEIFFLDNESPVLFFDHLNPQKLDYSIDSLEHINEYLDIVRQQKEVSDKDYFRIVLRTGAYVGEVIRRNESQHALQWISYEQFSKLDYPQEIKGGDISYGTMSVLYDPATKLVTFPLQKVEKYLYHGSEDDLKFYAKTVSKILNNEH